MQAYVAVIFVLFILSILEVAKPGKYQVYGWIAATIIALFGGLRFQTGFDWPAYEQYFKGVSTISQATSGNPGQANLLVEPLYEWFNIIVKSVGGNVLWLFFIIAVFNAFAVQFVISRISRRHATVWMVYFGVVFLLSQMAILRQAIGSSFVLLGLMLAMEEKPGRGLASVLIGAGFQVSSIIFAPVIFLRNIRPAIWISAVVVGTGVVIAVFRVNLVGYVLDVLIPLAPRWIAAKLLYYRNVPTYPLSFGAAGLICAHLAALAVLYLKPNAEERRDPITIIAMWLVLLLVTMHLFAFGFASVWNRVMLVTVPWEIAAILRLSAHRQLSVQHSVVVTTALFVIGAGSLVYSLAKAEMIPYRPYHSIIQVWMGDEGTGRERSILAMKKYALYGGVDASSVRSIIEDEDDKRASKP